MNIKTILTGVAVVGLTSTAFAGDVQVYGKINTSIQNTETESAIAPATNVDQWEVNSNESVLGVKGSHQLTSGLKAIYKAEYQLSADGDDAAFEQRNIYAGLQGGFGTVIAGKHDTPTEMLGRVVDRFNNQKIADIENTFNGEDRPNNTVMYSTPRIAGVKLTAAAVSGEAGSNRDSLADGRSVSLDYKNRMMTVGVSYDNDVELDDTDLTRVVAGFNAGPATVGLMYQMSEDALNSETDGWLVSAASKVNANVTVKAQYGEADTENSTGATTEEAKTMALGADYKLSKKAKAYAYLAQNKQDIADTKDRTGGVGLEVKF